MKRSGERQQLAEAIEAVERTEAAQDAAAKAVLEARELEFRTKLELNAANEALELARTEAATATADAIAAGHEPELSALETARAELARAEDRYESVKAALPLLEQRALEAEQAAYSARRKRFEAAANVLAPAIVQLVQRWREAESKAATLRAELLSVRHVFQHEPQFYDLLTTLPHPAQKGPEASAEPESGMCKSLFARLLENADTALITAGLSE